VENHQNKLEDLKKKYEEDVRQLLDKHNEEIEDLKKQIVNNKVNLNLKTTLS